MPSQEEKQRQAELNKARYQYLKARGRCVTCGERDAYTMAGRVRCADCTEKKKPGDESYRNDEENRKKIAEKRTLRYKRLKAAGICADCEKRDAAAGKVRCTQCLAKNRNSQRHKREDVISRDIAKYIGLCVRCLKHPTMEEKSLCEMCYQKTCDSLAEARKMIKIRRPLLWGAGLLSYRREPDTEEG